jgi:hypothetical protein
VPDVNLEFVNRAAELRELDAAAMRICLRVVFIVVSLLWLIGLATAPIEA